MVQVTPEMIAAAWQAWHARHGGKLGPGPAFVEAIQAALAAMLPRPVNYTIPGEPDGPVYINGVPYVPLRQQEPTT